jgi:hypothetical protein
LQIRVDVICQESDGKVRARGHYLEHTAQITGVHRARLHQSMGGYQVFTSLITRDKAQLTRFGFSHFYQRTDITEDF